jgi:hypothetical protein
MCLVAIDGVDANARASGGQQLARWMRESPASRALLASLARRLPFVYNAASP